MIVFHEVHQEAHQGAGSVPHNIGFITPDGRAAVEATGSSPEEFMTTLETVVAHHFNWELDEGLKAGENVKTQGLITTETMPVDFCLVIVAWDNPGRGVAASRLSGHIKTAVRAYFLGRGVDVPSLEVHLQLVGPSGI